GSLIVLAASERMQVFESAKDRKICTYAASKRVIRLFGNFTCILVKGTADISISGHIGVYRGKIVRFFISHHVFSKLHVVFRYFQLIAVFQGDIDGFRQANLLGPLGILSLCNSDQGETDKKE